VSKMETKREDRPGRRGKRRKFTDELKAGAARLVLDENKTVAQVARDLDVAASVVGTWGSRARANRDGGKTGQGPGVRLPAAAAFVHRLPDTGGARAAIPRRAARRRGVMAAMAHMYNKTSVTLGRGATASSAYKKTRGSALASGQHQAGTPGNPMTTTAVYNKTSTPEGLIHHDDGNGRWSCITKPMAGSDRSMDPGAARLACVLLTELA
jgi:transposase-like protein